MTDGKEAFSIRYPLLSEIQSPDDLKAVPVEKLGALASEIRSCLINQITENGGHLASNLGAVELTLAIHRVFSTPHDHLIFDVGHQSYIHKLVTGRQDRFGTLRQSGGLSGFPKRCESVHDCFGTGHSSTSLSAALGFAEADHLSGSDAYTVCVLGDGAYTGGMIHEALNNCRKKLRLIIVLNENEMSISKNIGRFAKELSHLRASRSYIKTKYAVSRVVSRIPLIGKRMVSSLIRMKKGLKEAVYGSNMFENLGLFYLGPVDGNDEAAVERLLREAKETRESCIIHLKTKKGKGYAPAEATPAKYHGMPPACSRSTKQTFSQQMGAKLCSMAQKNDKICAITAAMADGTGLLPFCGMFPARFFDVGIAEEHAVTFAAGLAANGFRPAVAIYSTFLQRSYDNIIHDVALQELPVVFLVDRAGMNLSDGPTHYGVFDVAFLSQIPHLTVYTPVTAVALYHAMDEAFRSTGTSAIRYPNGCESARVMEEFYGNADPGGISVRNNYLHQPSDTAGELDAVIVTHGRIVTEALIAADILEAEGKRVGILLLEQLAPYKTVASQVSELLPQGACTVLFLEEEIRTGGMGMMLSYELRKFPVMQNKQVEIMALEDPFCVPAQGQSCWQAAGLDAAGIVGRLRKSFRNTQEIIK